MHKFIALGPDGLEQRFFKIIGIVSNKKFVMLLNHSRVKENY